MIDCSTYEPLPDYYAGILWSMTMGRQVLPVSVKLDHDGGAGPIRAYAHCAPRAAAGSGAPTGTVTILILNTDPTASINATLRLGASSISALVSLSPLRTASGSGGGHQRVEYHLTGPKDTNSTEVALGGKLLAMSNATPHPLLPKLEGEAVVVAAGSEDVVVMAPASIAFVQVQGSALGASLCS
jgi:hypothetical protein